MYVCNWKMTINAWQYGCCSLSSFQHDGGLAQRKREGVRERGRERERERERGSCTGSIILCLSYKISSHVVMESTLHTAKCRHNNHQGESKPKGIEQKRSFFSPSACDS